MFIILFLLGGFKSSENIFISYLKLFIKNFIVLSILVGIYFVIGVYFENLPVIECSSDSNSMNIENKTIKEKDVINIKAVVMEMEKIIIILKLTKINLIVY